MVSQSCPHRPDLQSPTSPHRPQCPALYWGPVPLTGYAIVRCYVSICGNGKKQNGGRRVPKGTKMSVRPVRPSSVPSVRSSSVPVRASKGSASSVHAKLLQLFFAIITCAASCLVGRNSFFQHPPQERTS